MKIESLYLMDNLIRRTATLCLLGLFLMDARAAEDFRIQSLNRDGILTWTNAHVPGAVSVQSKSNVTAAWMAGPSRFSTTSVGQISLAFDEAQTYYRLLSVDISGTPAGHSNLVRSFGVLETIAGKGEIEADKRNNWLPEYEWGSATNANLSRPHIAYAQPDNNLLLVDEGSGSVLRITTNGLIHTYAGTHVNGFNGDGPAPATNLHLHFPNGGWMAEDGRFYVMDTYNSRIRKIDTNGIMSTMFEQPVPNDFNREGRGLWVRSDESEVFYCAGTVLSRWTPTGGVEVVSGDFADLGNMHGDEGLNVLYVTDRDRHSVYRMDLDDFDLTRIAGNGTSSGGGDGFPAVETGLNRPRTVAFLPNGGYLIGEHSPGYRVWYVDPAGVIHLWLAGGNDAYAGDGEWFYENLGTPKVGKVRALTVDRLGNVIMVVNDLGWVRRIRFERLPDL